MKTIVPITLVQRDAQQFDVFVGRDPATAARLGEILREVDGFFVFYPTQNGGAWTAHILAQLASKLDELNEPWLKQIDQDFSTP